MLMFPLFAHGCSLHVLVRADNRTPWLTSTGKAGVLSAMLLKLTESLWVCTSEHLMSLRAFYIPGLENRAPTWCPGMAPSRTGGVSTGLWWSRFGHGSGERGGPIRHQPQFPLSMLVLPDAVGQTPLGLKGFAHAPWQKSLCTFSPLYWIPPGVSEAVIGHQGDRYWSSWLPWICMLAASSPIHGNPVSGGRGGRLSTHPGPVPSSSKCSVPTQVLHSCCNCVTTCSNDMKIMIWSFYCFSIGTKSTEMMFYYVS